MTGGVGRPLIGIYTLLGYRLPEGNPLTVVHFSTKYDCFNFLGVIVKNWWVYIYLHFVFHISVYLIYLFLFSVKYQVHLFLSSVLFLIIQSPAISFLKFMPADSFCYLSIYVILFELSISSVDAVGIPETIIDV